MQMYRHPKDTDLMGYRRGAHVDGDDVCPGFEFYAPGSASTPERPIWGWNDARAMFCKRCGCKDEQHVITGLPPDPEKELKKRESRMERERRADGRSAQFGAAQQHTAALQARRAASAQAHERQAEDASGLLDESNDPLSVHATFRRARPAPAAPIAATAAEASATGSECAPTSAGPDGDGAPKQVVPMGRYAGSAALLGCVGLEQRYLSLFEAEDMEPDTLIEVLQQQGKGSLDEALKELGIKSMGHRMKIINAMIVQ